MFWCIWLNQLLVVSMLLGLGQLKPLWFGLKTMGYPARSAWSPDIKATLSQVYDYQIVRTWLYYNSIPPDLATHSMVARKAKLARAIGVLSSYKTTWDSRKSESRPLLLLSSTQRLFPRLPKGTFQLDAYSA